MATVEAHHVQAISLELLLDRMVCYQKHKPGNHLFLDRMPDGFFKITTVRRFGDRTILNDGVIVLVGVPTVVIRGGRAALLLPTGEELFFSVN